MNKEILEQMINSAFKDQHESRKKFMQAISDYSPKIKLICIKANLSALDRHAEYSGAITGLMNEGLSVESAVNLVDSIQEISAEEAMNVIDFDSQDTIKYSMALNAGGESYVNNLMELNKYLKERGGNNGETETRTTTKAEQAKE